MVLYAGMFVAFLCSCVNGYVTVTCSKFAGLINFRTLSYDGSLVRKRSTVHCVLPANYSLPDDFYKWNEYLQGSL